MVLSVRMWTVNMSGQWCDYWTSHTFLSAFRVQQRLWCRLQWFLHKSPSVIVHFSMFDNSTGGWRAHVDVVWGHVHGLMPTMALLSGVRQCHDPWLTFVGRTSVWHWDGSVSHLHTRWQTDQAWRCGPIEGCNNTALDWKCGNILAPALMGTKKDFGRVIRMAHIFCISVGQNVGEVIQ